MIYIFDDRYERRESYTALVKKNHNLISFESIKCETIDELENFILDLEDASMILLHSSYRYLGDVFKTEEVVEKFSLLDIPVVLFSGGFMHPSVSLILGKHKVYNINSIVMYQNLEVYLSHLKLNQSSPIDILIWGESYIQNIITRTQSDLFRKLCVIPPKSNIGESTFNKMNAIIEDYLRGEELITVKRDLLNAISVNMTCEDVIKSIISVTAKTL